MSPTSDAIRRWRWPAGLVLGIFAAGVIIALLQPTATGYLDPRGTGPEGGHALADLLTNRGQQVIRTAVPATGGGLELVTSPSLLTAAQLGQLARFRGDLLIVDPDAATLTALAPAVRLAGQAPSAAVPPRCTVRAAVLAGDADLGGVLLAANDPAADFCFPNGGGYSLIEYSDGSRMIEVLGNGTPLTNESLADRGDAALALNLLRSAHRILWLVPSGAPSTAPPTAGGGGQRSFFSLVPRPVYLIAFQLAVAALLAVAWRARRLGPVVTERLAVTVRASETVEGHGRLYQARRARDSAAEALRTATRHRLARLTGLTGLTSQTGLTGPTPPGADGPLAPVEGADVPSVPKERAPKARAPKGQAPKARRGANSGLVAAVAGRTGRDTEAVAALLYGPAPASDAALVTLASDLDTLEREVLR